MEILFIPIKIKINELKNFDHLIKILPKKIGVVCLIQYLDLTSEIIEKLKNKGFNIIYKDSLFVLGCNIKNADLPTDTILLVGDGRFHAVEISRRLNKNVIIYNPITGEISEISKESYRAYLTTIYYLMEKLKLANNIGLIVSIKPGQYSYNLIKIAKEKLKDKKIYLFIGDKIELENLANFPYIDFWVIIACPRIIDDIIEKRINAITIDILNQN